MIETKQMTDLVCLLIKFGYGNYETVMKQPMHLLLAHHTWFVKDYEKDMKAKKDYDLAILKAVKCPLMAGLKRR